MASSLTGSLIGSLIDSMRNNRIGSIIGSLISLNAPTVANLILAHVIRTRVIVLMEKLHIDSINRGHEGQL
jgi:hypothetical protein